MALKTLSGTPWKGIALSDAQQTGITAITQASFDRSAGTIVKAKNNEGDIKAVLIGKEMINFSVSGYSESTGADLFSDIKVGQMSGKVVSASVEASVEDFQRFSAEGRALKAND